MIQKRVRVRAAIANFLLGTVITLLLTVVAPWVQAWYGIGAVKRQTQFIRKADSAQVFRLSSSRSVTQDMWTIEQLPDASSWYRANTKVLDQFPPIPHWVIRSMRPRAQDPPVMLVSTVASGLPFRAATFNLWIDQTRMELSGPQKFPKFGVADCLRVGAISGAKGVLPLRVPLRPIWTGLLGNLLVWTFCVAIVRYAVLTVLRAPRRRQGACMECGYDLRGSPGGRCPECGTTQSPQSETHTANVTAPET